MRKRLLSSVTSLLLVTSTLLGSVASAENLSNVKETVTQSDNQTGKDYVRPDVVGSWSYNSQSKTFSWKLDWKRITYAKGYKIYRKKGEESYKLLTTIEKEKTTSFVDNNIEFGTTYTYKLNYIQGNKEVELSPEVTIDYKSDTDKDGLADILELSKLNSDPNNSDTDKDGLPDGYEFNFTLTSPTKADTDSNGIVDGDEDLDNDGLTNIKEYKIGTEPKSADTDKDNWNDGKELEKGTDPLKSDTDGDKVLDGDEEEFNFNPLKKDTNGNGILDGDEIVEKKTVPNLSDEDANVHPSVVISSKASEASSTSITNIEATDSFLNDKIPGYLGAPFEFKTKVPFKEAKMTFTYDKSLVKDGFKPEIFYYNEKEKRLEKVENQTTDLNNNSVTATVTHFSKYLLLDGTKWDEVWNNAFRPGNIGSDGKVKNIDVVFSIDSSGSMSWTDPEDLRKIAAKNFVDKLKEQDRAAVVDFDDYGRILVHLTQDSQTVKYAIDTIDSYGGTNLYDGVHQAVQELHDNGDPDHLKYVIFLTDGDGYWDESGIDYAKQNGATIYTIGLGAGVNSGLLQHIAESTGGKYFFASQADELQNAFDRTAQDTTNGCSDEDNDHDGLSDCLETKGLITGNGEVFYTDPNQKDSDNDGLLDGEEIVPTFIPYIGGGYYEYNSDPNNKDTDGDYRLDGDEKSGEVTQYNFTQHLGVLFSTLSYENIEDDVKNAGKKGLNLATTTNSNITSKFKRLNIQQEQLKGWRVIDAEDSHWYDTGFGGLALKKGNMLVFAYRGTDGPEVANDWVLSDASIGTFNNNWTTPIANRFAANNILNQRNPEYLQINVTGHSLGGFLAQTVSYGVISGKLYEDVINGQKKDDIRNLLSNNNLFGHAYTYNAAPFFVYTTGLMGVFTSKVPYNDIFDTKYYQYITNYSIDGDPLSWFVPNLGERIGEDPAPFDKTIDANAHTIRQYYTIFYQ